MDYIINVLQIYYLQDVGDSLAERTRFELVVGLLLRQFSKLVVSATHPPLHYVRLANMFLSANYKSPRIRIALQMQS